MMNELQEPASAAWNRAHRRTKAKRLVLSTIAVALALAGGALLVVWTAIYYDEAFKTPQATSNEIYVRTLNRIMGMD